jgi:hypothetical protein
MKTYLTFAFLTITAMVYAQPVKVEWPRSFTGQPDFAFTRDEALADAKARAVRNGDAAPQVPTLLTIATDDMVPDPLRLRAADGLSTDLIGAAPSGTLVGSEGEGGFESLGLGGFALPAYASPTALDLTEYKATLAQTISSTIRAWQPNPDSYDFGSVVKTLVLQAVVKSPETYAVINGMRYTEGSTFLIRVPLTVPDGLILEALDDKLPPEGVLDEASATAYKAAAEEALAAFAAARNANPMVGQQVLNIPVRVGAISDRKVELMVYGKPYSLGVKMLY